MNSSSSITKMLQSSSTVWKNVNLTDELKVTLEYDAQSGQLNIFVKNTGTNDCLPCHINVLSKQSDECKLIEDSKYNFIISPELPQDLPETISDNNDDPPTICYEISTTYVYDIIDENENTEQTYFSPTMITSSPSSSSSSLSSWCGESTTDNDDGYSTHSLDDIEQQQSTVIPLSKSLVPSFSSSSNYSHYSEQYILPVRQLIEQLTWLSPFKKTMHDMMTMSHMFD